ncbi:TIM-barrel domain-containing protein [Xylocopilactobacillus apicola]|uniref:Uncharacterized protein n=1 Tax=Xylocopilactobacillus apicola TaxID=2932184 RepID=A0AAU9CXX3_9LACO|nr:TIM-barrel domain-containing protein [Xylocopilactobacillus apicola]BDR58867.1 hypothetical protein XA3_13080 [Xylocopilactobacillus apicola]
MLVKIMAKKHLILGSAIALAAAAFVTKKSHPEIHKKQNVFNCKLKNGYKLQISFVDRSIAHIVYYRGKSPSVLPTTMKNERVQTGGDQTVATGKLDQKETLEFIQNDLHMPFDLLIDSDFYYIQSYQVGLMIKKKTGMIYFFRTSDNYLFMIQNPPVFENGQVVNTLEVMDSKPRYFGGGMQNGRYDHTGQILKIENQNDWLDRGVSSPSPFVWSTAGFGILNHTFGKGEYNLTNPKKITFSFSDQKSDNYYLIESEPEQILRSYFDLTGAPLVLPKFAWYPAHLNAYNRDTWVQVSADSSGARKFEDGQYYKEYQPLNSKSFNTKRPDKIKIKGKMFVPSIRGTGEVTFIKDEDGELITKQESLNGEKDNYQFSARQIIKRYQENDMPLGWFVPNDGYGAGYGQTQDLDQNIRNLKEFSDFAAAQGVKTGLWTQENLHPKNPQKPRADERDLAKEVGVANIAALKTDVAWVGSGYQAGYGALVDIAHYMKEFGHNERPFALTLDGWAGTQKYAAVWTGDQRGGTWENIGYQIPTYLGSALSGVSNVGSDLDGIYGGGKPIIQTRDLQWKAFTPLILNMDGWGSENKTPFSFGGIYTEINRFYLKLKSELLPYFNSLSYENIHFGQPIISPVTLDSNLQLIKQPDLAHEFLVGENILVAPIYEDTQMDPDGNDVRHGIYLPDSNATWIDFFTGDEYEGHQVLNNFAAPLWKIPLFIKKGAILPVNNPNNNIAEIDQELQKFVICPDKFVSMMEAFDDDGVSNAYQVGEYITTDVSCKQKSDRIVVTIEPTMGNFAGFQPNKRTILLIKVVQEPSKVLVNGQEVSSYQYEAQHEMETFSSELPAIKNGSWVTVEIDQHDICEKSQVIEILN